MTINIQIGGSVTGHVLVNQGNGNATAIGDGAQATVQHAQLDTELRALLAALQSQLLKPDADAAAVRQREKVIEALEEDAKAPAKDPGRLRKILDEFKQLPDYFKAADAVQQHAGWISDFLSKCTS